MQFQIHGNPDYGELTVGLEPGERFRIESGAMSRMSRHLDVKSRMLGGFLSALVRKLFGGEAFFVGEYSGEHGGWLTLSPRLPGTVLHRKLNGDSIWLTAGSFLACTPDVHLRTKFGGFRAFFSGEGAFLIEASGHGDLFLNAYGAVMEREVKGSFIVDTGHVVGFEPSLSYRIRGMGGLKQTLFSGEGLVMRFEGHGKIFLQTRTLGETAGWLSPFCLG